MKEKNIKTIRNLIIIFVFSLLFFILLDIRKEEGIKENTEKILVEKINSEINNGENLEKEQQSTDIKQNVEKEYIEKEFKGYKVNAKLYIPQINLETYVLEEYSIQSLLTSVTKFYGGEPNTVGNYCIAGHNYGPSNMFQNIKKLNQNDEIFLTDINGNKYKYVVYDIYKVWPNDTKCLTQETQGNVELTLITCTLDSEKRIIVKAVAK